MCLPCTSTSYSGGAVPMKRRRGGIRGAPVARCLEIAKEKTKEPQKKKGGMFFSWKILLRQSGGR